MNHPQEPQHQQQHRTAEAMPKQILGLLEQRRQEEALRQALREEAYQKYEEAHRQRETWFAMQPDRECTACKLTKKAIEFGHSISTGNGELVIPKLHIRCRPCHEKWLDKLNVACPICGKKKRPNDFINDFQGTALIREIARILLCCNTCEKAFLALPERTQRFYIRSRCNQTFPAPQIIYAEIDPETREIRYIGRTGRPTRRHAEHQRLISPEVSVIGPEEKQWYSRKNWMYDLSLRNLKPIMQELFTVEVAPQVIEWEDRYIFHAIQQNWQILNRQIVADNLVSRIHSSKIDFLQASFEDLVNQGFMSAKGVEAFVRAWYKP
jgi:hypothetical protein